MLSSRAVKLLEENVGKLLDIGLGDYFLDMTSQAQATKAETRGATSN